MLTPTPAAQATPSSQMQGMPGMYADATLIVSARISFARDDDWIETSRWLGI